MQLSYMRGKMFINGYHAAKHADQYPDYPHKDAEIQHDLSRADKQAYDWIC